MKKEKVVLAYSGGLDTSVILKWLQENYGYDVVAVAIDVGQGSGELDGLKEKALNTGAVEAYVEDVREEFVTDYIYPMIKSGAVYEGKYLLGTAIARPVIVKRLVEVAKEVGAVAIAHGSTGKGNDQIRFELGFKALAPQLKIIAPWREWDIRSRTEAIAYAKKHNIPIPVTLQKPYSLDRNLWHISYEGGILEDLLNKPDEKMFNLTSSPEQAPNEPEFIELEWRKGIPVALNGEKLSPVALIETLNVIAGKHGIGRIDIVENRLVGMKSRGVYETPAGTLLYFAHRELEHVCLDRDTLHFKEQQALKYAEMLYYGLWFTTLRESLDAFFEVTQKNVSGTVTLKLYKGNMDVIVRKSSDSLYDPELATFEADTLYNQKDAEGFINLFGLPLKINGIRNLNKTT